MPRPMDSFLCPYCFKEISHDAVHFRSARVDTDPTGILPDDYDIYDENDRARFMDRYSESDKEDRILRLAEWEFFKPKEDADYEKFWRKYGGTKTEVDPLKRFTEIDGYLRPIINPNRARDRGYLQTQPDGGVFIRDADGMVEKVKLKDGTPCADRVCPHCHNPLPPIYGKHPIKYVTIIGMTHSGKTVYLSQLLKHMDDYVAKVGLTSEVRSTASKQYYCEVNKVAEGEGLPTPTPRNVFQQPLFYDLSRMVNGSIQRNTFVLYDVAGEVFEDSKLIKAFTPFVERSDGFIMLIDPEELQRAEKVSGGKQLLVGPNNVLTQVRTIVHSGRDVDQCSKPFAICVSKIDTDLAKSVFEYEEGLLEHLNEDVAEVIGHNGLPSPAFNASGYDPVAKGMNDFMRKYEKAFMLNLTINYEIFAFFGFTALGCKVENNTPTGPIIPKRIEEPLLWLLYEFGFIGREGEYTLPNPIACPECGRVDTVRLTGEDTWERGRWPWSSPRYVNRRCRHCGNTWEHGTEE